MKVPVEITYRDVEKTTAIDSLVHEKIAKLERVCDYISSCRIAIEHTQTRPRSGSPFRVRIDMTVPPSHELVADSHPSEQNQYVELDTVIRDAFSRAERQLKDLKQQQLESDRARNQNVQQDNIALVVRLFREDGYGFLKDLSDEEIYFHRNSVLHDDFDRVEVGTAVRFVAEEGNQGLQATTVQIVDKPGHRVGETEQDIIQPPLGWRE